MKRVQVAKVLGAHGVKGLVKLLSLTEDPVSVAELAGLEDEAGRKVTLSLEGSHKGALLVWIEGVETREAAEALKGAALYVPRSALPEPEADEFYFADLVGLEVEMAGEALGVVVAVADFGAGPLLEVRPRAGGGTVYVPFTREAVPRVDIAAGRMEVVLPPGLWPGR